MGDLLQTYKGRASLQAQATIETSDGTVAAIQTDSNGNVISADVTINGQVVPLKSVDNASGLKLWVGAPVKVNYSKGTRTNTQIIGMAGSTGATILAEQAAALQAAVLAGGPTPGQQASAGEPYLTAFDVSDTLPDSYVPVPWSPNLLIWVGQAPVDSSGGNEAGRLYFNFVLPLFSSLPNPNIYPDGTIIEVSNSYGTGGTLYRLYGGAWQVIGGQSSSSGGGSSYAQQTDTFSCNGSTNSFTLSQTPSGSVIVSWQQSSNEAYLRYNPAKVTVSGNTITLSDTPPSGATILADYITT